MEVLKDISKLTKGCGVTFIKNDKFHFYEYLMVHPNRETYYLFIDYWTQDVVRIHVSELLNGDYYIGEYDSVFVNEKMIHNILEKSLPLKGVECFYGTAVLYKVPKSEFEKEVL